MERIPDDAATITLDHETRIAEGDHLTLKLWLRLLTCTNLIEGSIRSGLRRRFDSTLPRFDLLAQLERSPQGLRMSDLSERLMVTGGNVTGLADQLEAEGLIARHDDPDDRRVTRLALTPAGRRRFAEMARVHAGWIDELFGALSRDEQATLHALLGTLKRQLHATPAEPAPRPSHHAPTKARK